VDTGLDKNETELGILQEWGDQMLRQEKLVETVLHLVLAVLLQVLAHGDGLLDKAVQVLREGWGKSCARERVRAL